jgi:hypothetical protein
MTIHSAGMRNLHEEPNMTTARQSVRTIDLGYEQMLLIDAQPQTRIKVLYGGVWLTEEGRYEDTFLTRGEEFTLRGRGRSIAQALLPARLELVEIGRRRADRLLLAARTWLADVLEHGATALRPA